MTRTRFDRVQLSSSEEIISAYNIDFEIPRKCITPTYARFSDNQTLLDREMRLGQDCVAFALLQNPNLQLRHFRHLLSTTLVRKREGLRGAIIRNPATPTELLSELASTEENPLVRRFIADHPNTTEDDRVIAVLRGVVSYDDYLEANQGIFKEIQRSKEKEREQRIEKRRERIILTMIAVPFIVVFGIGMQIYHTQIPSDKTVVHQTVSKDHLVSPITLHPKGDIHP